MKTKKQILNESSIDSLYNTQLILEVLLDIRDLQESVEITSTFEPSKPSDTFKKIESEIRADERAKITKQIEKFAHTEMKDGNWTYEKLLILLKSLK